MSNKSKTSKFYRDHPELNTLKIQHVRTHKPDYFIHEEVCEMSVDARYAQLGLWTCCDWHGRFEWRPKTLKLRIMPFDNVDFEALMDEWVQHGFVRQYEVDGKRYGVVLNWAKHQAVNKREKDANAVYPAPPSHVPEPVPAPVEPVPARAVSAVVDVGIDVGDGKESHSINPSPNDGLKDPSCSSDIDVLSAAFHREAGAPFKAGNDQKPVLAAMVHQHTLEVVSKAVEIFAMEDGHNWSMVICPAALFIKSASSYIADAKRELDWDKRLSANRSTQTNPCTADNEK